MKRVVTAIIFITLAVPAPAAAGDYGPERILSFTRYLIARNQNYRALLELNRLQSYYPEYCAPVAFHVTGRYLLFRGERFAAILGSNPVAAGPLAGAADSLFRCDAAIALSDLPRLEAEIAAWPAGVEPFLDLCLKKRRLYLYLMERRFADADVLIDAGAPADFSAYRELVDRARAGISHEKKPWLAAVLGLMPGMGYVYSGDYGTGIFAFLLIAVDVILTYFAFRTGNEIIGYATGTIGCLFYAGSIAGGYIAARRFNTRQSDEATGSLAGALQLDRDREEMLIRHGLGKE